jgi:hypothetical protein
MSRAARSKLKGIVKECLIEILSEGIGEHREVQISESVRSESRSQSVNRRAGLDNIVYNKTSQKDEIPNPNFEKNIRETTRSMTADPVLSSILADTAMTTLQEQAGAERPGPGGSSLPTAASGDVAAVVASKSDPQELFGESAQKWADLAFATTAKRS